MPKTLEQVLSKVEARAKRAGPEAAAAFARLDAHFAGVARELDELRRHRGLTQREVAARSDLDQAEVSRILAGRTEPRVGTAQRLARALGAELRVVKVASPLVRRGRAVSTRK